MYRNPKGLALKVSTEEVDSSAVRHPNGEKVAGSFADRPRPVTWVHKCTIVTAMLLLPLDLVSE